MAKATFAALAFLIGGCGVALATDVALRVEAQGFESTAITVGPGCGISYRVVAELDDTAHQGLAALVFDLNLSGGALAAAEAPTGLPMAAFAPPNGLSNPDGYGGTSLGGRLVQVGGSQNVTMHGQWSCESDAECPGPSTCDAGTCSAIPGLPVGDVVPDVAYPGSPVTAATGSLVTPAAPGCYDLTVSDPAASILVQGATGRGYWPTEVAGVGSLTGLSITVQHGAPCTPGPGACCLPDSGLCTSVLPEECIMTLGGTTHGSDSVCEGDLDGDGSDGACGDLCPDDPNKLLPGLCGCGVVDDSTDTDGDSVPNCVDQCPGMDDLVDVDDNGVPDCLRQMQAIPTVSDWGLVLFALLVAVSAALVLSRRRM
jgi:hypothetical protein